MHQTQENPYFLGIAPPLELSNKIGEIQKRLHKENETLLQPLIPHITLLHPGCAMLIGKQKLLAHAQSIVSTMKPIIIRLDTIDMFGSRVLHIAAASNDLKPLHTLCAPLPTKQYDSYYNSAIGQFRPHITIAQTASGETPPDSFTRKVTVRVQVILPAHFVADHPTLFVRHGYRNYIPEVRLPFNEL